MKNDAPNLAKVPDKDVGAQIAPIVQPTTKMINTTADIADQNRIFCTDVI